MYLILTWITYSASLQNATYFWSSILSTENTSALAGKDHTYQSYGIDLDSTMHSNHIE